MCIYSVVGDNFGQKWGPLVPWVPTPWNEGQVPNPFPIPTPTITQEMVDEFKAQVKALEELLAKAKKYDEITGQPGCELESKKDALRRIAKELGVDITFP